MADDSDKFDWKSYYATVTIDSAGLERDEPSYLAQLEEVFNPPTFSPEDIIDAWEYTDVGQDDE